MNESSVKLPPSDRFRKMADAMDHNTHLPFGGSCVIIPPEGGGEPVEVLLLDIQKDPAQFWATIATRIQMRVSELDEKQRVAQGYGRR